MSLLEKAMNSDASADEKHDGLLRAKGPNRRPRWLAVLLIGVSFGAGSVNAAMAADDPCDSQRTTLEINACARQQSDAADEELNATYEAVIASLDRPDGPGRTQAGIKNRLIEAQRHWVQFREKNCDAVLMKNADGTVRTSQYLICKQQLARERAAQLRQWFLPRA